MKRLPPLAALEAFVETGRRGSVKAAADALALSSPALSRRLQTLERHVGQPLFVRRHQAIGLSPAGHKLLAEVAPVLESLSAALDRATGTGAMDLRLGVPPLFAGSQLVPRLPRLRKVHPDLHIELDTQAGALARLDETLDAAIVLAASVDETLYARSLGRQRVVAVGSEQTAARLKRPEQIAGETLLIHRDLSASFDHWRRAIGLPDLEPAAIDTFDSGPLILDAAAEGLGIAFMFEKHLERHADGRLRRLFDVTVEVPYSYWFACRPAALSRRPVRLFHDWLVREMAAPVRAS